MLRIVLAAAAAVLVPSLACAGEWLTSYAKAYELCKEADKPIFVYFTDSSADKDWKKRFDGLDELTDKFILVAADKSTPEGLKLLGTFELTRPEGAVVIDRTRQWQFFRADRQLTNAEIKTVLAESKEASGKPASSVLRSVSHSESSTSSFDSATVRPANYCPNCQRFR